MVVFFRKCSSITLFVQAYLYFQFSGSTSCFANVMKTCGMRKELSVHQTELFEGVGMLLSL